MAKRFKDRILVAVDGSDRSVNTARYIADNPCFRNKEINFFYVFTGVPEWYWDLTREPPAPESSDGIRAWQKQKRREIEDHLDRCRSILLSADFNPDRIQTTIHPCKQGVARDILNESRNGGYGAVVLRRRGASNLDGLAMGSVALKMLADMAPLIFAGRKPVNNRILLALDGSDRSSRALDFVCELMAGQDCVVRLVNVLRGRWFSNAEPSPDPAFSEYIRKTESDIAQVLAQAAGRLIRSGFSEDMVDTRILTGADSRAGAIVDLAEKEDFSTIVVGAKGLSRADEFIMGRVSSKLLYVGRRFHIWIVK